MAYPDGALLLHSTVPPGRGQAKGSTLRRQSLPSRFQFFIAPLSYSLPLYTVDCWQRRKVEWKRNLMAHGEAREEKWRGKRRMEWVASTHALYRNTVYPALLPVMHTPRLPAADWTDTPTDINGLVRFAGRPNLVSARVPSHSVFTLKHKWMGQTCSKTARGFYRGVMKVYKEHGRKSSTQQWP